MDSYRRRAPDLKPWLRDTWWLEAASGVAALLWSMFAISFTFRIMDLSSMRVLLAVLPESVWQSFGLAVGLGQCAFCGFDLRWPRWTMSLLAAAWWSVLTYGFAFAWHTPSVVLYFVMAVASGVSLFWLLRPR